MRAGLPPIASRREVPVQVSRRQSVPEPLVCLLVAAFAALLYANSVPGGFVSDDHGLILNSERIHSLRNVPGYFLEAFAQQRGVGRVARYYRPVVSTSFALDYAVGGPYRPWVFHLTNVLAYGVCASLVYALMRHLVRERTAAVIGALLFSALAVHTETVSWISGRTDLFALAFMCGALLCLLRARSAPGTKQELVRGRPPYGVYALYAAGFLLALLALLSKEVALTLLPIWIVFELTWGRTAGFAAPPARRTAGVAVLVAATGAYLAMRWAAVGATASGVSARLFDPANAAGLATIAVCVWQYLGKLALPMHLSFGFEVEPFSAPWAPVPVLSLLGAALVLIFSAGAAVRRPGVGFSLWWMWLGLAPALNVVPLTETAAERFLFVPSVGFCLIVALVVKRVGAAGAQGRVWLRWAIAGALVLAASHAVMTLARNAEWHDQRALYLATVESSPLSATSQAQAAEVYLSDPPVPERARLHYTKALELSGEKLALRCLAHNSVGRLSMDLGDLDIAVWHLREALALNKSQPVIRTNLALALTDIALAGGPEEAWAMGKQEAEKALSVDRRYPEANYVLGMWYLKRGRDPERAGELFGIAAGLDPALYGAHYGLALACLEQGKLQEALRAARDAFTIRPTEEARALMDAIQQRMALPGQGPVGFEVLPGGGR